MEFINLDEVREKLVKKLENTGWDQKLRFFCEEKLPPILTDLLREAQDGRRFVPKVAQIFRAFETCHFDKTRVVILGQSPYPYVGVPDGLAFSCTQKGKRVEKSLSLMFAQINKTVYDGKLICVDGNLERWANQGVLLLNCSLTTGVGSPENHMMRWKPMVAQVLDSLIFARPDTAFVFMGKHACSWEDYLPDNFLKIKTDHPAFAAYQKIEWDSKDCFNKINRYLESIKQEPITW
jgi:uracil-DNA glycosylase